LQGFDDKDILNRLTGNQNDETLPNFIKRKHPKKGREKKNNGQGRKSKQASKQLKRGGPQGGKGTSKNPTLHQLHESYQQPKDLTQKELAGKT
jgi:hypothetical protein